MRHVSQLAAGFVAAALVTCLAAAPPAQADTASDLAAAMAEVDNLQSQAEAAYQSYEAAGARLAEINNELTGLQQQLAAQTAAVETARAAMGRAARASYIASGVDSSLLLLLSDNGDQFTNGLSDLRRVSDATTTKLATNRDLEAKLKDTQEQIAAGQQTAQGLRDQAQQASDRMAQRLRLAQSKQATLERRYAAELAAAKERQRQQAAAVAAQTQDASAASSASGVSSASTSELRQRVISFALSKLGHPYVFGADGPNAYDCSGLVSAAYAQAGITVGSYTGTQAKAVRQVPLSAAQPGDLLFFFGQGAAHVAIYLGNGRMVHAVNPSQGITINRITDTWYRERFTMAGALLP
jgi:peptidoglycan DL-endopeptidase CwlO